MEIENRNWKMDADLVVFLLVCGDIPGVPGEKKQELAQRTLRHREQRQKLRQGTPHCLMRL
jgi:hypothetical protein